MLMDARYECYLLIRPSEIALAPHRIEVGYTYIT